MTEPRWLDTTIIIDVHAEQLALFGGPAGVRDTGLLESALARPINKFAYGESDLAALAAAYAFGIARNHPFVDAMVRSLETTMHSRGLPLEDLILMREQRQLRDDTRYMHRALEGLGVRVQADEAARTFVVDGVDGRFPADQATLEIGNAGTAARFLTAAVALGQGTFMIDGSPAMRKRPIQPLLDGLRALGVDAESREGNGCPPVVVRARGIAGGRA